jgi:hypothetical protein
MQLERFSSVVMNVEDLAKALQVLCKGCGIDRRTILRMEPRENWGVELTLPGWNFALLVPASQACGPRMELPLEILAPITVDYADDYPDANIILTSNHDPDEIVKIHLGDEIILLTLHSLTHLY